MTIDPARRLAQALGLDALGHAPQRIHVESITGELHAMMLDTKRTFDSLIEQYAPSDCGARNDLRERYYQHLSNSLAGSREFMAMEKVYEMAEAATYDLLIVDTPPAQHALDFLEAPERLFDLFEGSFVNLLLQPYRVAGRIGFDLFRRQLRPAAQGFRTAHRLRRARRSVGFLSRLRGNVGRIQGAFATRVDDAASAEHQFPADLCAGTREPVAGRPVLHPAHRGRHADRRRHHQSRASGGCDRRRDELQPHRNRRRCHWRRTRSAARRHRSHESPALARTGTS